MLVQDGGVMYDDFQIKIFDISVLEKQIHNLIEKDVIMKKVDLYRYVFSNYLHDLSFHSVNLRRNRNERHTSDKRVSGPIVTNSLNWKKWKLTISPRGKKVAPLLPIIARCYATTTIV